MCQHTMLQINQESVCSTRSACNACLLFRFYLFKKNHYLNERAKKYTCFYCSENGFEDSLSTLGLVSGLFSAVWSAGYVPTMIGYLTF